MPDGLIAGPAAGTYYTLMLTVDRNISRPRGVCESQRSADLRL